MLPVDDTVDRENLDSSWAYRSRELCCTDHRWILARKRTQWLQRLVVVYGVAEELLWLVGTLEQQWLGEFDVAEFAWCMSRFFGS